LLSNRRNFDLPPGNGGAQALTTRLKVPPINFSSAAASGDITAPLLEYF
jgi:hypothetical protein